MSGGFSVVKTIFPLLFVTILLLSGCQTIGAVGYLKATEADKAGKYKEAAELYAFVANSPDYDGRYAAQYRLAEMYFEGIGVEKNLQKALSHYEAVSNGTDISWKTLALFRLGHLNEIGVPGLLSTDRIRAANYYEQGALLGDKPSKQSLDRLTRFPDVNVSLHKNEFSPSSADPAPAGMALAWEAFKSDDYDKAFRIFLWHAKHGNATAQRAVGIFYELGLSVDVDLTRFAAWTYLAARNGNARHNSNSE